MRKQHASFAELFRRNEELEELNKQLSDEIMLI